MGLLSTLKWKLTPADKKLAILKKRGLTIGKGCEILNGYELGSEPWLVTIGNNVRITGGVKITTHDGGCWVLRHKYPELADCDRFGHVTIGDNCHIGMNAMILPGSASAVTASSGHAPSSLTTSLTALWSPASRPALSVR